MIRWARSRTGEHTHAPPPPPAGRWNGGAAGRESEVHQATAAALTRALGTSSAMARLGVEIQRVAARDPEPVLLIGEPGTGKGEVARLIHRLGHRAHGPFEAVPCAGLDPAEAAQTLFGWAGAGPRDRQRTTGRGLLEAAHGGTVFLDPIERLDSEVGHRLIGFLEDGTLHPLGGTTDLDIPVDVRLIAATHLGPEEAMRAGSLSPDLHQILGRAPIHLPPLRERAEEDRVTLVHRVARDLRTDMGRGPLDISPSALSLLIDHPWPGNLREMRNVMERAILAAGNEDTLRPAHLPSEVGQARSASDARSQGESDSAYRPESLETVERRHIEAMLRHHGGNRTRSARDLGIARATLINKIKAYELDL